MTVLDNTVLLPVTGDRVAHSATRLGFPIDWPAVSTPRTFVETTINETLVRFGLLAGHLVVRALQQTDLPVHSQDPRPFLACNQINSTTGDAKTCIIDDAGHFTYLAEKETVTVAGLTDAQLDSALAASITAVLSAQKALADTVAALGAEENNK